MIITREMVSEKLLAYLDDQLAFGRALHLSFPAIDRKNLMVQVHAGGELLVNERPSRQSLPIEGYALGAGRRT